MDRTGGRGGFRSPPGRSGVRRSRATGSGRHRFFFSLFFFHETTLGARANPFRSCDAGGWTDRFRSIVAFLLLRLLLLLRGLAAATRGGGPVANHRPFRLVRNPRGSRTPKRRGGPCRLLPPPGAGPDKASAIGRRVRGCPRSRPRRSGAANRSGTRIPDSVVAGFPLCLQQQQQQQPPGVRRPDRPSPPSFRSRSGHTSGPRRSETVACRFVSRPE
mmetsp:Transcript_19353/g.39749  ORF Transcript_19353/g.39749 Transcript_19353/m.39749 type:complete len:217 (+) Transcript_19353:474-1124(+)